VQAPETNGVGERGRNRTYNLLIKSQLLCQLSYAPTLDRTAFIVMEGPSELQEAKAKLSV
jgi:hypothetical protein